MRVFSTVSDHGKSIILSRTLSWITITARSTFVFTSCATVTCLSGECDSVLFPVDGGRKTEEKERRAVLRSFSVPANGFVLGVLYSMVRPLSRLCHAMTGILWEPPHLASIQPRGFLCFSLFINVWPISYSRGLLILILSVFSFKCKRAWHCGSFPCRKFFEISSYICCFYGWEIVSMLVITGLSLWCLWVSRVEVSAFPPSPCCTKGHLGLCHCSYTMSTVWKSAVLFCWTGDSHRLVGASVWTGP